MPVIAATSIPSKPDAAICLAAVAKSKSSKRTELTPNLIIAAGSGGSAAEVQVPDCVSLNDSPSQFTCKIKGHEAIEISLPIDWSAFENIDKDRYWKIQFFSLSWLRALEKSNPYAIPVIAIEYCKSFFALETPAPFTWDEHCLADRIEVLAWVISLEQKGSIFISDQDFILIIRLLLIHSILILDDRFYAPNHNHGFMQDVSLIKVCSKFSSLNFFAQAKIKAENRLLEMQISKSLTKDGAHKENSPGYHLHFLKLLTRLEKIPELSANFQQTQHLR